MLGRQSSAKIGTDIPIWNQEHASGRDRKKARIKQTHFLREGHYLLMKIIAEVKRPNI